jgi:hypothetical protein
MKKLEPSEIRTATIKEFVEKMKEGLGGCRLMYDEAGQGFVTEDVYNLINIVVSEMESGYHS